jgi:Ca2+-binding RTX toxin-like protein
MATSGNDVLRGTDDFDLVDGLGGNDVIFGHKSNSTSPTAGVINAVRVGTGFDFTVAALSAPDDPSRLYVVEKDSGKIYVLNPVTGDSTLFLDIPDSDFTSGGEQGVLGLAFHPNYVANGRFFVHVVNSDGDVEVREYRRTGTDHADASTKQVNITVQHSTFANHNGGSVVFGPDGFLYVSIGDGGGGGDPFENAQDKNSLLGKILRLDIDHDAFPRDPDRNYDSPRSNPFVGQAGANEIWAYGLRNPFRITFDSQTGDLYIGDVGQASREEIDFQPAGVGGLNYGWDIMEGTLGPQQPGFVLPIFDYGRNLGTTVTGGYVYRGPHAGLDGSYFFTDFGSGRIWTLKVVNNQAVSVTERTDQFDIDTGSIQLVSSFGVDGHGNLYTVGLLGDIYRIDPTSLAGDVGDRLLGGAGNDRVYGGAGNDVLFGGTQDDTLSGGFGNDRLDGGTGIDIMFGGDGSDIIRGGSGNDRMDGDAGNDYLNGDTHIDVMRGGGGNDTYIVGSASDRAVEASGGGTDRVVSVSAFTLGVSVENLALSGSAAVSGTGNNLNNVITGNSASNLLNGRGGNDTLVGRSGGDTFAFNTTLNAITNVDRITDFSVSADTIRLENSVFVGLANGTLAVSAFFVGAAAHDGDDRIVYNDLNGMLFFDQDGDGSIVAIPFARLVAGLALTNADFMIV